MTPNGRTPARILIIKPSSLGDIVHALPTVSAIREAFPAACIEWIMNTEFVPLLEGTPVVNRLIPFPRTRLRGLRSIEGIGWFAALRRLQPDLAIDLQGLLRSALMGRCSRPQELVGMSDAREGARLLFQRVVSVDPAAHAVDRMLDVLPALGFARPGIPLFPLPETPWARPIDELESAVILHPFSRGAGKSLPRDVRDAIIRAASPRPVLIVGRTLEPVEDDLPDNAVNLANRTTLPELVWLMRRAAAVVSVDSGPAHIAAAVARRLLAIHTWSDPRRVGPYGPAAQVWKGGQIACTTGLHAAALQESRAPTIADVPAIAEWIEQEPGSPDPDR